MALTGTLYAQDGAVSGDGDGAPAVERGQDERELRFAPASDTGEDGEPVGEVGAFGVADLLRMVLVLLMVIGAIYGVVSFLRRRTPSKDSDEDSPIRLLATRNIGANRDLYAVMIGRQVMVLGGGDQSLQLITTVDDQETIDELVLAASSTAERSQPRTFGSMLGRWIGNAAVPGSGTTAGPTPSADGEATQIRSFLQVQQERLRRMR